MHVHKNISDSVKSLNRKILFTLNIRNKHFCTHITHYLRILNDDIAETAKFTKCPPSYLNIYIRYITIFGAKLNGAYRETKITVSAPGLTATQNWKCVTSVSKRNIRSAIDQWKTEVQAVIRENGSPIQYRF
jgi:hypothetical protein